MALLQDEFHIINMC